MSAKDPTMTASAELRTGGEWIVEALRAEGVRHVFGRPGVHNLAIYDALLKQHEITHVLARHEQGAAFMADGYARASGRPGVVAVTTGPGATNTLTPMVESWAGSQPVLTLMSDIPSALIGKDLGALHEVPNQIDCFRPVCRWAETIYEGRLFPAAVTHVMQRGSTRRPRCSGARGGRSSWRAAARSRPMPAPRSRQWRAGSGRPCSPAAWGGESCPRRIRSGSG